MLLLTLILAADPTPIVPAKLAKPVEYAADVQPMLAAKCTVCHAGKTTEGRYDMGTHAAVLKGGKRGVAVVPGKPMESTLYLFASHNKKPIMPPRSENNDLTPEEVAVLKAWIEAGAKGPTVPETTKPRPTVSLAAPAAAVVPVRAVAVSPDKLTVAAARGNQLHLYDAKTGAHKKTFADPAVKAAHVSLIESMAYSPDGKTLATGSFREVVLWDTAAGTVRKRLTGFAHTVTAVAFSADGKRLAAGGGAPTEDGEVKLFDPATGTLVLELKSPHSDTVYGVAFSPDGKLLATGGADKFVKTWTLPAGTLAKSFEGHTQHVLDVGWTPDGKRIVSAGADGVLKVWDFEKGEKARDIPGSGKQMTRLAFVGTKAEFLTASGDGTVRLHNPDGGNMRTYSGATDFVYAVAASADGTVVVAGGEDGVARLYEGGGKLVKTLLPPGVK